MPTAVIAIPVQSAEEARKIRHSLDTFGAKFSQRRYRSIEVPFFRDEATRGNYEANVARETNWQPTRPNLQEGFAIELIEQSPQCDVIKFLEWSGVWTPENLDIFEKFKQELADVTENRSIVFTPPNPKQNWPTQDNTDRPAFLEELCIRMGLPDPRELDKVEPRWMPDLWDRYRVRRQ